MNDGRRAPRVTVVIATYNWATVLPCSIGSVLDQTFADFELLVIGDGCTDESARVVGAIRDPRVEWVNLPHNTGHQAGPNNEGLRRARGGVVAYLGHDDLWLPHHLEMLVPVFEDGTAAAHTSVLDVNIRHGITISPPAGWSYTRGDWIPPTSFALERRALVAAGGWRGPRDTGDVDPEADLLARIDAIAGPPAWVPRLTCVKLPASTRRNVYRTRPSFEQEHWLRTIRESADPEATLRATGGSPYPWTEPASTPRAPARAWRRLRRRFRAAEPAGDGSDAPRRALTRYRRNRRYKGL
ncbi:MAG: glycosyltransferase family 2 protein [Acidimicrobiia bacterium]